MKHLYSLLPYFLRYKWQLIFGLVFVTLSNYFKVLQPQVVRKSVDYVLLSIQNHPGHLLDEPKSVNYTLFVFGITIVGLSLLMGLFMYFMRQTIIVMSRWIEFDLRNDIFQHYTILNQPFFKTNTVGDLLSRITEDVSKVRMAIGPAILYCINLITLFVLALQSMFRISTELAIYSLMPLPILSISIYYVSRLINQKSEQIQKQLAEVTTVAQESYSGIRILKSFVMEHMIAKMFRESTEKYRNDSMKLAKVNSIFSPLILLLIGTSTILTIYIGGLQVIAGKISYGNIAEFVIYINMLTWPVTSLGWIASLVQQAAASQKRINEFLQIQPVIVEDNPRDYPLKGDLSFQNVTFTYPETGVQALKNLNFDIHKGEKIAILGKTGAGKSTIVELLLRLYDPNTGRITIDGIDLKSHSLSNIRRRIAYVPQDVFLFSDTIYHNIALNDPTIAKEKIEEMAKHVCIYEDIMRMPDGFDTIIGERGVTLSGGQKQRIAIARALIKQPDILVLDDCLSAVDTETEYQIVQYLKSNLGDLTTIVITHRVYSSLKFDRILTMDDGTLSEG